MTQSAGDWGHEQRGWSVLTMGGFSFLPNTRCAAASGYYMSRGIRGQDRVDKTVVKGSRVDPALKNTSAPEGAPMTTSIRPESSLAEVAREKASPLSSRRIALHRRATKTIRRHFLRDFTRVSALIAGDAASFFILRLAVEAVRAGGVGAAVGEFVEGWFPSGYLGGWQFGLALFLGLFLTGAYGRGDARHHGGRLFAGVAIAAAMSLWQHLWVAGAVVAGVQFVVTLAAVGAVLSAVRIGAARVFLRILPANNRAERVLFVGHPKDRAAMHAHSQLVGRAGMVPVGWVSDEAGFGDDQYLGYTGDIWDILQREPIDTVVLCESLSENRFTSVFEALSAAGCRVLALTKYESRPMVRPGFVWHHGVPFVELTMPTLKAQQLIMKRMIDIVGAAVGLVVLSPFLFLVAMTVKLDSPGPVLFSQERVGLGGRVFWLLKFRTMREGADDEKGDVAHLNDSGDPRLFKIRNDPRITKFGAWLRRWSIDELPQLWTVLRGHMSLVGPRPFFEEDLKGYSDHHFARLCAKPGITGLWQVKGRSDVVNFEEVVRLDREYIDRWSLWRDLKILALTIPTVFQRTGAY